MPVEASVQFVNVDLHIGGRFDRAAILKAVGNGVMALHEEAVIEGKKCLLLEVTDPGLGLSQTLMRLAGWVEQLPPKARRSLSLASIRRFDLGIQSRDAAVRNALDHSSNGGSGPRQDWGGRRADGLRGAQEGSSGRHVEEAGGRLTKLTKTAPQPTTALKRRPEPSASASMATCRTGFWFFSR